ncbi:MAG: chemotaxis protein methyltransferase CheR [Solirubrobacteraceae bacterium]|jgi:chemotaxis protein methyltransferase CheR|nr:chemotaxis protein methyltransferase CheR [Solirubrobacteraceae bacterium]
MGTIEIRADEYGAFCTGIRRLCGIDLSQYKRAQMERRIRTFAERRGVARLADYLGVLGGSPEELEAFLDRVTINVSQLWRNPEQWELLRAKILPEFADRGRLRAWSAGCSYGAEAYTLAATCAEVLPRARVEIVGTDIDRRMVERARAGVFSADDARDAPSAQRRRWFAERDGMLHADPKLRTLCRFETGDLLTMRPARQVYDLVLCRNTVIYFTPDVKDALHARIAAALVPGGYFMVGSTERITDPAQLGLEIAHPFVYRRIS